MRPGHRVYRGQRGAFALEAALILPILIGAGLIGADIQRIHSERIRLESTAGTLAVNLAAQRSLSAAGLERLVRLAMQGHETEQQVYILGVRASGEVSWGVARGGADGLCEAPAAAGTYLGTLPEDGQGSANPAVAAMIVVRACRRTNNIALFAGLGMPDTLKTDAIFPAAHARITLDPVLQAASDASGLARHQPPS